MATMSVAVVVPNWNGAGSLPACLDSLKAQSIACEIIVVDNGSVDGSVKLLKDRYPDVTLIEHRKNKGFAGGVNAGIRHAIKNNASYVALFNNDAVADKQWLAHLVDTMESHKTCGIVTCKLIRSNKAELDSTGDLYTTWGLPFPRGRDEKLSNVYDDKLEVFGASGGASLYRISMLTSIGLSDEDFFAYYEDVDISFRAQLAGWKVRYEPKAKAYHEVGATSGKIKGFTTYQTIKNLPYLFWKNVPLRFMLRMLPRFSLVYASFFLKALGRGQFGPALKGLFVTTVLFPKKLVQRWRIQRNRKVSTAYIASILVWDLPPNAHRLRVLRQRWWRFKGEKSG